MNEPRVHGGISSLEAKVASELSDVLGKIPGQSEFKLEPSADLCFLLELYVPQLLARVHPEWEGESLDGFLLATARKTESRTVELAGLCILISDQTVTPFFMRLSLNHSRDSIASYLVLLGESGGGHLGISGPPCNSPQAKKLLRSVGARLHDIRWSYTMTSDAN